MKSRVKRSKKKQSGSEASHDSELPQTLGKKRISVQIPRNHLDIFPLVRYNKQSFSALSAR